MALLLPTTSVTESPLGILCAAFVGILVVGSLFVNRTLRRIWDRWAARDWPTVTGKFKQGEVVRVAGRYESDAAYVVCIDYDYPGGESSAGLHTYTRDFRTQSEADQCLKHLENQSIPVRVAPNNPRKAYVLDKDIASLLQPSQDALLATATNQR